MYVGWCMWSIGDNGLGKINSYCQTFKRHGLPIHFRKEAQIEEYCIIALYNHNETEQQQ